MYLSGNDIVPRQNKKRALSSRTVPPYIIKLPKIIIYGLLLIKLKKIPVMTHQIPMDIRFKYLSIWTGKRFKGNIPVDCLIVYLHTGTEEIFHDACIENFLFFQSQCLGI